MPPGQSAFERRQFRKFVRLLTRRGVGVRLPSYRGPEVGCWRSFVAMYPESVDGLSHVIATSPHGNDVAFAAAMLPMLALSNDPSVQHRAWKALRFLGDRRQDFSAYAVRRELVRAPAESGDPRGLAESVKLITAEGSHGREARFLSRYGWTPAVLERNLNRKLQTPTRRDEQLKHFYETMGDVVLGRKAV